MPREPRLWTMIVLACALFLRLSVPDGWMPAPTGGPFAIEPCPAAAPMTMPMGGTSDHGSSHKGGHDGECAFAPFQTGIDLAAATPPLHVPQAAPEAQPERIRLQSLTGGSPAPPPPATGPPALA